MGYKLIIVCHAFFYYIYHAFQCQQKKKVILQAKNDKGKQKMSKLINDERRILNRPQVNGKKPTTKTVPR